MAIPPTVLFPMHSVVAIWNYAPWGSDPMSVFLNLFYSNVGIVMPRQTSRSVSGYESL